MASLEVIQAAQTGDLEVIDAYLKHKSREEVAKASDNEVHLLHWAMANNHTEVVKSLIRAGAPLDAVGGSLRETPLQWAVKTNKLEVVHYVLSFGVRSTPALLDQKSSNGYNALHYACMCGNFSILLVLLEHGADPNAITDEGESALILCTSSNAPDTLFRVLLRFGADVHYKHPDSGNTVLHECAKKMRLPPLDEKRPLGLVLYEYGGDLLISSKNVQGSTAYDIASKSKNGFVGRFLTELDISKKVPPLAQCLLGAIRVPISLYSFHYFGESWFFGFLGFLALLITFNWAVVNHGKGYHEVGIVIGSKMCLLVGWFIYICAEVSAKCTVFFLICFAASFYLQGKLHITDALKAPSSAFGNFERLDGSGTVSGAPLDEEEGSHLLNKGGRGGGGGGDDESEFNSGRVGVGVGPAAIAKALASLKEGTICSDCLFETEITRCFHCDRCNACMLEHDQHCAFVANCIGRGNRLIYFWYLSVTALLGICFLIAAWRIEGDLLCPEAQGILWGVFAVQWCMLWSAHKFLFILCLGAGSTVMMCGALAMATCIFVVNETSAHWMKDGRFDPSKQIGMAIAIPRLWKFFTTGDYNISLSKDPLHPRFLTRTRRAAMIAHHEAQGIVEEKVYITKQPFPVQVLEPPVEKCCDGGHDERSSRRKTFDLEEYGFMGDQEDAGGPMGVEADSMDR